MTGVVTPAPRWPALRSIIRRRIKASALEFQAPEKTGPRQMLVDVSVIIHQDARTGIQRVVRALLGQLLTYHGPNLVVRPVFATRDHGYCVATLDDDGNLLNTGLRSRSLQPAAPKRGDVFLGLDLAAHVLPYTELDLARWRAGGVSINVMVYDLLPLLRPAWFPPRTHSKFKKWIDVLARQADCCICISADVAGNLAAELRRRGHSVLPAMPIIPMGVDITASRPSTGLPDDVSALRAWVRQHRALLCVGTVEPRKGHEQLLKAFSNIWATYPAEDVGLIVVGKPGWKTSKLQQALREHPEQGKRLIWLDQVSDEMLSELYVTTAGLVAASHGEGFGLPLAEALAHGAPVLARDIPVFREVGAGHFDYFVDDRPEALAARIMQWLEQARRPSASVTQAQPRWSDSARVLADILGLPEPAIRATHGV